MFITEKLPPPGRTGKHTGKFEKHLYEAAVMLAIARWLFESGAEKVYLHPDGEHAKQFDICRWLGNEGFEKIAAKGKTPVAGTYVRRHQTLYVEFKPGQGDVVADIKGCCIVVEAKGGIINTSYPGQKSKLRKHLYEAIGMLLDGPKNADRLIVAVPQHSETEKIARRMAKRCRDVGIELALISGDGTVQLCD